jgi:hypothetical protein
VIVGDQNSKPSHLVPQTIRWFGSNCPLLR